MMSFEPFMQWGKALDAWQKMMGDSVSRTQAFYAEFEKLESMRLKQAETMIDEIAKLQKETLAYTAKMGAEFRKASLEAMTNAAKLTGN